MKPLGGLVELPGARSSAKGSNIVKRVSVAHIAINDAKLAFDGIIDAP